MTTLSMTAFPKPPAPWFLKALCLFAILCLMLELCGCSTPPAAGPSFVPPAAAMTKSQALPQLPVDPGASDDAPSAIGLKEMVDDSITVTTMYRDLARRHDELVDAVNAWIKKQAQ